MVRDLYARGANREVIDLAKSLPAPLPPGVSFYVAAALVSLEQTALARHYLTESLSAATAEERGDLVALEGLLASLRGDAETYLRKAVEANGMRASAHTLFHLGMALPGRDERLRMLQASLIEAEGAGDRYAEARSANALASLMTDSGRFAEALSWSRFALDRATHPGLRLTAQSILPTKRARTGFWTSSGVCCGR